MNKLDSKQLASLVASLLEDPQDFKRITRHKGGRNYFYLIKNGLIISGSYTTLNKGLKCNIQQN